MFSTSDKVTEVGTQTIALHRFTTIIMQGLSIPRGKCLIWHFSIPYLLIKFALSMLIIREIEGIISA